MKISRLLRVIMFCLMTFLWLFIMSGVIYTIYFAVDSINIEVYKIDDQFLSFHYFAIMGLALMSNFVFGFARTNNLSKKRRILLYITSVLPTLLIAYIWLFYNDYGLPKPYINYFNLFISDIFSYPQPLETLFGIFLLVLTVFNLKFKSKAG